MNEQRSSDEAIFDVLIVGAGLSGIGAARHLQREVPNKRYLIVEARAALGGTWDVFRYPGVRSDSDMYTLGYGFKPWTGSRAIVDGASILRYLRETADEAGITRHIRFGHRVRRIAWSSEDARWTVHIERRDAATGDAETMTWRARFVWFCAGYYSYTEAYRPEFAGEADFRGTVVHPQFWPESLDCAGKRVVVVGSGATAVTLVPALADKAAHVTMLQRSPSYVVSRPSHDAIAAFLQRMLPARLAYSLARWKNVAITSFYYRLARKRPERFRERLLEMATRQVGAVCDARTHFAPRYAPWDQRLCLVPDGDLFRQIRHGRASIVTDTIDCFTSDGLRLASGQELAADIVVVATGLKLIALGDAALEVDGCAIEPGRAMVYKGALLAGVPNLALTFGYANASWTLRADLTAGYVCRLLRAMDRRGAAIVVPERDAAQSERPFLGLTSGYVQRAAAVLPKQGSGRPWRMYQSYVEDLLATRLGRIDDGVLRFTPSASARPR